MNPPFGAINITKWKKEHTSKTIFCARVCNLWEWSMRLRWKQLPSPSCFFSVAAWPNFRQSFWHFGKPLLVWSYCCGRNRFPSFLFPHWNDWRRRATAQRHSLLETCIATHLTSWPARWVMELNLFSTVLQCATFLMKLHEVNTSKIRVSSQSIREPTDPVCHTVWSAFGLHPMSELYYSKCYQRGKSRVEDPENVARRSRKRNPADERHFLIWQAHYLPYISDCWQGKIAKGLRTSAD